MMQALVLSVRLASNSTTDTLSFPNAGATKTGLASAN